MAKIKVTRVEGTRFPKSTNIGAEKLLLEKLGLLRSQTNQQLNVYAEALKAGGNPLKMAARHASHSFAVKFTSAIIENKRLPFERRASLTKLESIAHDLHLEAPCHEPVPVHAELKANGGFRPICDFGHAHRTAQTTARRMLALYMKPRLWQYDFQGTSHAIEVIRDAILSGKTAGAHIDIKNFYGSFDQTKLREALPVPGRMVDHYLVGRKLEFVPWGHSPPAFDVLLSKAREGVSHGSSASPIIGADTVSKLHWQSAPGVVPGGYVDDLMLVGASHDVVAADAKAVCAAIAALPTGNFLGVVKWTGDVSEGFDYLGVHMRMGTKLEIHPAKGRLEAFKLELNRLFEKAVKPVGIAALSKKPIDRPAALQAISEVWRYAEGWLEAFRVCDEINAFRQLAQAQVDSLLAEIDCEFKHLKLYGTKPGYPN
jgi:hypothetical protein